MTEEKKSVSRRTVVKGAAWTVPVIAVAATVPTTAASQPCIPTIQFLPDQSFKCCSGRYDGPDKTMQVSFKFTDLVGCIDIQDTIIEVLDVALSTGRKIGAVEFLTPRDAQIGAVITVILRDVHSCTVNLRVSALFRGNVEFFDLKSENIEGGTEAECDACVKH